jgi:hypothetical protein
VESLLVVSAAEEHTKFLTGEMVDGLRNVWLMPTWSVSPVTPYYERPPAILRRSRIFLHDSDERAGREHLVGLKRRGTKSLARLSAATKEFVAFHKFVARSERATNL